MGLNNRKDRVMARRAGRRGFQLQVPVHRTRERAWWRENWLDQDVSDAIGLRKLGPGRERKPDYGKQKISLCHPVDKPSNVFSFYF